MKVSIIIPCYNTAALVRKNLPAVVKAAKNPKNQIREIIVVDDASPDESAEVVAKEFPEVRLIRHRLNRGFSASVNTGARMAKGEYLALLNTDVIPSENFLENVLSHFEDGKVFAVSLHERGYAWAMASFKDGFVSHALGEETQKPHLSFWASGGSAVFRRKGWMELGGMDEKLFSPVYWEDIDLSYRAQKRGMIILWEPAGLVVHKHESTVSQLSKKFTQRIRERNELLFIWKNITSPPMFRKHLSGLVVRILRGPGYIRIVLMALAKSAVVVRERKREKKEAKVSDEAIFNRFR